MLAGSRTRTGKPKIERAHQPKSMALRSLSIVEAKSNLAGLPRRDQDEPSSPVNAGLKLTHLSVGLECASMLPSLVIENPCAAVADLSPTKRAAVIECFNNRGLHKCNGYWCGPPEEQAHFRCYCCRPRSRWRLYCNQKPSTRFSAIDRTRPMVCTDADRSTKLKRMCQNIAAIFY